MQKIINIYQRKCRKLSTFIKENAENYKHLSKKKKKISKLENADNLSLSILKIVISPFLQNDNNFAAQNFHFNKMQNAK